MAVPSNIQGSGSGRGSFWAHPKPLQVWGPGKAIHCALWMVVVQKPGGASPVTPELLMPVKPSMSQTTQALAQSGVMEAGLVQGNGCAHKRTGIAANRSIESRVVLTGTYLSLCQTFTNRLTVACPFAKKSFSQ